MHAHSFELLEVSQLFQDCLSSTSTWLRKPKYLSTAAHSSIFSDVTSWLDQSLCPPFLFMNMYIYIYIYTCITWCVCVFVLSSAASYNASENYWGLAAKFPCTAINVRMSTSFSNCSDQSQRKKGRLRKLGCRVIWKASDLEMDDTVWSMLATYYISPVMAKLPIPFLTLFPMPFTILPLLSLHTKPTAISGTI